MITALIISGILSIFIIGFIQVYNRHNRVVKKIEFADEYRYKFVEFANKYFQTYDRYSRSGDFDGELYVWLTMNVSKIQNYVGSFGVMSYKPAFQNYMINNYQIIINTIPKFREGQVENLYGSLSQKAFKGELSIKEDNLMMAAEPNIEYKTL